MGFFPQRTFLHSQIQAWVGCSGPGRMVGTGSPGGDTTQRPSVLFFLMTGYSWYTVFLPLKKDQKV